MIVIEALPAPVVKAIGEEVLNLVADNVTELAMRHPPRSHPLFSAHRLSLLAEVEAYLARPEPSQIELVIAMDDCCVVGFALCGLSPGVHPECGVYYAAVARPRRGEGISSLMMREIVTKYSVISLSCEIGLVPVYERYGFEPRALRKHQVVMAIGQPCEETPILDPDALTQQPPIIQEQMEASARSTGQAVAAANKAMKKSQKTGEAKAKTFFLSA